MRYKIYQGETFTITLRGVGIDLSECIIDMLLYQPSGEPLVLEDVDDVITLKGEDTAELSAGLYTVELKILYGGRLYVNQVRDCIKVAAAESKDLLNELEEGGDDEPTLLVNVNDKDNNISISLSKSEGGGGVSPEEFDAFKTKTEGDISSLESEVSGVSTTAGSALSKSQQALVSLDTKADKSELNSYALKSEIPSTSNFATKAEVNAKADASALASKADKSELNSYALKSEIPSTSNFATKADVAAKADISALNSKADRSELTSKADKSAVDAMSSQLSTTTTLALNIQADMSEKADVSALASKADKAQLADYATKTDLTAKADVSALSAKLDKSDYVKQYYLTQAQYDNLIEIDPNADYNILEED